MFSAMVVHRLGPRKWKAAYYDSNWKRLASRATEDGKMAMLTPFTASDVLYLNIESLPRLFNLLKSYPTRKAAIQAAIGA